MFQIYRGSSWKRIIASNALQQGVSAEFKLVCSADGMMSIFKNGKLLKRGQGHVPRNMKRSMMLVGKSAWNNPDLVGEVLKLEIKNTGDAAAGQAAAFEPIKKEISGAFELEVNARFDNLHGPKAQRLLDFGSAAFVNNIVLGQCQKGRDMCFEVWHEGNRHQLVAKDAISEGEMATWKARVNNNGRMFIEKNGMVLADMAGLAPPPGLIRSSKLIGKSNFVSDSQQQGLISGVKITSNGETMEMDNEIRQIHGAFEAEVLVRLDSTTRKYQRIFDFGNGAKSDNSKSLAVHEYSGCAL